jgi:hypothetical protein
MPEVTLTISRNVDQPGEFLVVVDGTGFYEAENKVVSIRIRGSDEWYDDNLFNMADPTWPPRVLQGGFNVGRSVSAGTLNEDWGEDEVYALVSVPGYGNIRSNTIKAQFG